MSTLSELERGCLVNGKRKQRDLGGSFVQAHWGGGCVAKLTRAALGRHALALCIMKKDLLLVSIFFPPGLSC